MPMGVISTTMKLKIQLLAVPIAAPFVLMLRELISVGYLCNLSATFYGMLIENSR